MAIGLDQFDNNINLILQKLIDGDTSGTQVDVPSAVGLAAVKFGLADPLGNPIATDGLTSHAASAGWTQDLYGSHTPLFDAVADTDDGSSAVPGAIHAWR